MVASTDIKFYVHTNNSAPQLTNNFGCMLNVLDAALINGIQVGTVSSLTASGKVVTAVFGTAHNLMQYQVIKIAGANQAEYNVEARILTVPNTTTIAFELAAVPSVATATGTINCSLPSLGWEKPFSSTSATGGKGAYRSKNTLLPSRPFLRVVDELDPAYNASYAKYAKVGIVEDMTDIDTMLGVQAPYDSANPDKNWVGTGSGTSVINGWARWYYARNSALGNTYDTAAIAEGNRNWLLIGNADYYYIMPCFHTGQSPANPYGFGSFERYYDDDLSNTFLSASIKNTPLANFEQIGKLSGISSNDNYNSLLFKPIEQTGDYATANAAYSINSALHYSGCTVYLKGASDKVPLYPIILEERSVKYSGANLKTVRGGLSGIYALAQFRPLNDFQIFRRGSSAFIARYSTVNDENSNFGELVLKIGDL